MNGRNGSECGQIAFDVPASCQIEGLAEIYAQYFGDRTSGAFVDVGAADGQSLSNTSCFGTIGWTGLLFEPEPERYAACRRFYENRERVTVIHACVGDRVGEAKLFCDGSTATVVPGMIDVFNRLPWLRASALSEDKYVVVPMLTLDAALERHGWAPGLDVLRGFTIGRWLPSMVIVECHEKHPDRDLARNAAAINDYFDTHGYDKIHCDAINSIYVLGKGRIE